MTTALSFSLSTGLNTAQESQHFIMKQALCEGILPNCRLTQVPSRGKAGEAEL